MRSPALYKNDPASAALLIESKPEFFWLILINKTSCRTLDAWHSTSVEF